MELEESNIAKRKRAVKRVEELKGFYMHLTVYLLVNLLITIGNFYGRMSAGEPFLRVALSFWTYSVWVFWGLGLFFHAMKTFSLNPLFGRNWEERKIREFMEEEERQSQKFKR